MEGYAYQMLDQPHNPHRLYVRLTLIYVKNSPNAPVLETVEPGLNGNRTALSALSNLRSD
jgi:hypothetical protein